MKNTLINWFIISGSLLCACAIADPFYSTVILVLAVFVVGMTDNGKSHDDF